MGEKGDVGFAVIWKGKEGEEGGASEDILREKASQQWGMKGEDGLCFFAKIGEEKGIGSWYKTCVACVACVANVPKTQKARVAFPTWHEDLVAKKSPLSKAVQAIGPPSDPRMHRGRCDKKRQKMLYVTEMSPQTSRATPIFQRCLG